MGKLIVPTRRMATALLSVTLLSGAAVAWSTAVANAAGTATLTFGDGATQGYSCSDGTTYTVNRTVTKVTNGCGVRVWLHQNSNNTGTSFCTSKSEIGDPPAIEYANLYISSNSDAC